MTYVLPELPDSYYWKRAVVNHNSGTLSIVDFESGVVVRSNIYRGATADQIQLAVHEMMDIAFPNDSWLADLVQLPEEQPKLSKRNGIE